MEDVWGLPTPGGPDDLPRLVQWFTSRGDDDLPIVVVQHWTSLLEKGTP